VLSFVLHSSLLTEKSVNSVVACDDFLFFNEFSIFFILATLITQLLFNYHLKSEVAISSCVQPITNQYKLRSFSLRCATSYVDAVCVGSPVMIISKLTN